MALLKDINYYLFFFHDNMFINSALSAVFLARPTSADGYRMLQDGICKLPAVNPTFWNKNKAT